MFAEPLGQLVEFFPETVDGLLVHVCLGDEFGEGDWKGGIESVLFGLPGRASHEL